MPLGKKENQNMANKSLSFALFGNDFQISKSASVKTLLSTLMSHKARIFIDKPYFNFPEPKPEFIMPEKGENDHRVFSYLTKTRHIDANVVNEFIRVGVLFQDTKGNAIFLHKENGKPCGAEIISLQS